MTLQLSQLTLDLRQRQARIDLSNPYEMHSTLMRASQGRRLLWRQERSRRYDAQVIVQHDEPLSLDALVDRDSEYTIVAATRLLRVDRIALDSVLRFRFVSNPTITRRGKRLALVGPEAQLDWLSRKGAKHGFDVLGAIVSNESFVHARKRGAEEVKISFRQVTFDGHLKVRDVSLLLDAVRDGIGHEKAFGCGLMSLAGV